MCGPGGDRDLPCLLPENSHSRLLPYILSGLYIRLLGSHVSLILQLGKVSIGETCLAEVIAKKSGRGEF